MNPFIVSTIAAGIPLPAETPALNGRCRAYASNGSWRFRILSRYAKAAGLESGERLQLFRHDQGWVLRPADEPDRMACVTVDFEQKIQLHTDALGLSPTTELDVAAVSKGLVLRPADGVMPEVHTLDVKSFAAFGWRPVVVSALRDRPHIRFVDIQGRFLSDTGLAPGDKVNVTVFDGQVAVRKAQDGALLCMDKKSFPGFRLSARYFEQLGDNLEHLIAIFGDGGIVLVASKDSIAQFGLDDSHELKVSMVEVAKKNFAEKHKGREKLDGPEMQVPPSTLEDTVTLGAVAWTKLPVRESGKIHTRHIDIDGPAGEVMGLKRGQGLELRLYSDQVMLVKSDNGGLKASKLSDSLGVRLKTRFFDWLLEGDEVVTVVGPGGAAILRSEEDLARFQLTRDDRLAA
jgi:bifunctional DNA-binding transcriptional regulator/antitoxin component of YhaV-PrlF toxin-antitoxin module